MLQQRYAREAEADRVRTRLAQRYLYQLQDAAESLWFRLNNLHAQSGAEVMDAVDRRYREVTTLYVLGRYLAVQRMLTLDGIWPELGRLDAGLTRLLRDAGLSANLPSSLFHYDLIALGEALLERDEEGFRTINYLQFRRVYESGELGSDEWRARVWETLESFSGWRLESFMETVASVAEALQGVTGNETAVGRTRS